MNDIVDLTDRFSEIVEHYRDDTYGGLLDMDAWAVEDIDELLLILDQISTLRFYAELGQFLEEMQAAGDEDEDEINVMYSEYENLP